MQVNIVTVSSGWILQKIAERTRDYNKDKDVQITVSTGPRNDVDVNYYADIQNCYRGQRTNLDIGYFTHAHLNDINWLRQKILKGQGAMQLDGIVSMNKRYTDMLELTGYPEDRLVTITPGQTFDTFPLKKVIIGVVSRGGYPGYGQQFIESLFKNFNLDGFKFRFLGNGWDALKPIAANKKIDLELLPDADYSIYPKFYTEIDHLLIPGMWTAGPMSMQEALSTGVSVIGADVGFVGYEFNADYVFQPGNTAQLYKILQKVREPLLRRREQVESMSWAKYSSDLVEFFKKIKGMGRR